MKKKLLFFYWILFLISVVFLFSFLISEEMSQASPGPGCPSCLCNICPAAAPCPPPPPCNCFCLLDCSTVGLCPCVGCSPPCIDPGLGEPCGICCESCICVPDGCNANCPAGCTVAEDPDCGCQDGNGCCGIGCDSTNDNDCPAVGQPPVASFTTSATTVNVGETVYFDATASDDPDGTIVSYDWDFGDGISTTGATTNHSYSDAGTYTVTSTVTDNDGLTGTATATMTVEAAGPIGPPLPRECTAILDIVFAIDSTGSMSGEIAAAQAEAINIMTGIETAFAGYNPDIQYGVIDFRDYADWDPPYIIRQALTYNKTGVETALNAISAGGGGDLPEAYPRVMYESYTDPNIGYRPEALKILLMMGDDIPHDKAPSGDTTDGAYMPCPPCEDLIAGSTDAALADMTGNGITLIYLFADSPFRTATENNSHFNSWKTWAQSTGGSTHALPTDLVDTIKKAVARAIFDKDGDGYLNMVCPCDEDLMATFGLIGCWDCDDTDAGIIHECFYGGLVPCGRKVDDPDTAIDETAPCTLCHFFVLFKRIVDYVTINIIFPLAVLMFVIGGIMLLTATGDPERIRGGKKLLKATVIGLAIALAAWLIVNTIIVLLTPAGSPFQSWHTINCPVP